MFCTCRCLKGRLPQALDLLNLCGSISSQSCCKYLQRTSFFDDSLPTSSFGTSLYFKNNIVITTDSDYMVVPHLALKLIPTGTNPLWMVVLTLAAALVSACQLLISLFYTMTFSDLRHDMVGPGELCSRLNPFRKVEPMVHVLSMVLVLLCRPWWVMMVVDVVALFYIYGVPEFGYLKVHPLRSGNGWDRVASIWRKRRPLDAVEMYNKVDQHEKEAWRNAVIFGCIFAYRAFLFMYNLLHSVD